MYDPNLIDRIENALRAALPRWALSVDSRLTLLTVSENATFRADDPRTGCAIVIRVHRQGYHTQDEIASELAWISALRTQRLVSTLTPVRQVDGSLIADLDDQGITRFAVAFEVVAGREPTQGDTLPHWFRELGAINARLHAHARQWTRPESFVRKVWDFESMLGRRQLWGDWRRAPGLDEDGRQILERAAASLREKLDAYGKGADRFGLIHADLRIANLIVDGDTLSVIDFDDCGFGWYLYDFAAAISFMEHEPFIQVLQAAWIEGYRALAPLAEDDCAMLPVFIMLRRMLLTAWIASHAETPTAIALGEPYTAGTVQLASAFIEQDRSA